MSAQRSFLSRLRSVVTPTVTQVLGCIIVALALLASAQSHALLVRLGITQAALRATDSQLNINFGAILQSPIAGQAALVTFWAITGLVAYLVCWGAYNLIIEARNEVTLTTIYTNRGRWSGAYEVLAIKAVSCLGLALIVLSLWPGISFWLALSANTVTELSLASGGHALLAVLGFAFQLYLTLVLVQLSFTPWYRPEAFT